MKYVASDLAFARRLANLARSLRSYIQMEKVRRQRRGVRTAN